MTTFDHAKERRSKHMQPNPAAEQRAKDKRERRKARNLALRSTIER